MRGKASGTYILRDEFLLFEQQHPSIRAEEIEKVTRGKA